MDITDDLRLFAKLDEAVLTKFLSVASRDTTSVVDRASILREIEENLGDEADIRGLFRVVNHLASELSTSGNFAESFEETEKVIHELVRGDDDALAGWLKLKEHSLFIDGFLFSRKEQDLKDRFNRFRSIDITVDIRPVFDLKRSEIKKYINACIMKLKGDEEDIVLEIYEEDIAKIIEELNRAKDKLEVVKKNFKQ